MILSSGHKHADLFPCLPWGEEPSATISKCLIDSYSCVPTLVSKTDKRLNTHFHEQFGVVRFSDCVGGFCWAGPLPPLGRIITSLGAQHPFGAFSNAPICNQGVSLGSF